MKFVQFQKFNNLRKKLKFSEQIGLVMAKLFPEQSRLVRNNNIA